ncbi:GDP/GTP exchange factor for ARF [Physocladia obscura]|uniref:GDP/GTP exchange factor for ARF n=1 Tax=Physocladia obscura TaxID=109957 RepID=A0AAD5T807_9FUNG|nr:GDP/GTP exchange factor for ARF [Physocladia obscura]
MEAVKETDPNGPVMTKRLSSRNHSNRSSSSSTRNYATKDESEIGQDTANAFAQQLPTHHQNSTASIGHAELAWMHVIHAEILAVTATMRKNSRWSLANNSGSNSDSYSTYSSSAYSTYRPETDSEEQDPPETNGKKISNSNNNNSYDFCADLAAHAPLSQSRGLEAVLEFTNSSPISRHRFNNIYASGQGFAVESPLLAGFSRLKARLSLLHNLRELEPIHLLTPFLEVIKSGDTTGPITGAALSSVEKFIKFKIIADPYHPSLPHAMSVLTHTVSNCKFEATDAASDEVVLTKILRLIRVTVKSEAGQKTLDDKAVCEMVETAFGMCFQGRVSELLKKAAEQTLVTLVQSLFERLIEILKIKDANDRAKTNSVTPLTSPSQYSLAISRQVQPLATSSIMRSLQARQKNDSETVFASQKGSIIDEDDISNDVVSAAAASESNGPPVISIGEKVTGVQKNNEPEMIAVGPQQNDSEFKINVTADAEIKDHFEDLNGDEKVTSFAKNTEETVRVAEMIADDSDLAQSPKLPHIFTPFGLPAILELIRVLVTLMDPRNRNHTDTSHRLIALTLLHMGIETGGYSLGKWIGWGYEVELNVDNLAEITDEEKMAVAAKELVVSELIKYLFQLLQNIGLTYNSPPSSSNMMIITLTLRVLTSLFQTSRHFLKFQFEYFLCWIMNKVDTGIVSWDVNESEKSSVSEGNKNINAVESSQRPSSAASISSSRFSSTVAQINGAGRNILVSEARELLLETMVQCCRIPGFFTELWVNFDGDAGCQGNLYEEVVRFLSKHAFSDATPGGPVSLITHQIIAIDGLLLLLSHISERKALAETAKVATSTESLYEEPYATEILAVKLRKRLLAEGADRFNRNPKDGIRFLQEHKLLPEPVDPRSIAVFLKTTPGVNKKLIGEYIAKRGHEEILKTFISPAPQKRLDEGLRLLLESFRLPGEAQLIERVVENFAEEFFHAMENDHNHHIADQTSGFVLAFSIILLNTDQHNPQVRRRMTFDDFRKNNRGCNDGKDFDTEYLRAIYEAIKNNEIVMPEEHEGDLGFNYAWKELMKKAATMSPIMTAPRGVFSKDMFAAICDPTIAAISYAFDSSEDSLTLQKAVVGFHRCASISNLYQMTEALDNIVISLSKTTGLLKDRGKLIPTERKTDVTGEKVIRVDPWAVEFGRNYKSQVAAVLMFNLASEYGNTLRAGWKNNPNESARPPKKENSGGSGLFFSLTQLLSLGAPDDEEQLPTPEELKAEKNAIACIVSCRIEELFLDTRFLEESSLNYLMNVIAQACYNSPKLTQRLSQVALYRNETANEENVSEKAQLLTNESSSDSSAIQTKYSLAVAFYLELIANITLHNRDRLKVVWPVAFDLISQILNEGSDYPLLLERCVVGLLKLLIRMVHKDDMLAHVFRSIQALTSLSQAALNIVAEQLMAGLLQLIKTDPTLIRRYPKAGDIVHLLSATALHTEASRFSLEIACILVSEGPSSPMTADNFGECIDLLMSFSNATGVITLNSLASASPEPGKGAAISPRITSTQKSTVVQAANERAAKALDKVFSLNVRIPIMILKAGIGRERAWFEFWLPILSGFAQQCCNPAKEIRQHSLTLLQRSLLSPELESTVLVPKPNATGAIDEITTSTLETGVDCFENVLFPLLEELLKPEIGRLDGTGMSETRMRVAGLLCKIFLQYLNHLLRYKDLPKLWVKILDYIYRYVTAGGSEFVSEGVLESLKNMLLVMSTQKVFQPLNNAEVESPDSPNTQNLWIITWEHIDRAYPGLKEELFPSEKN